MGKRPVYFHFLKEKSISKIQKEPSEQCLLCTEATCEQPTFQPLPFSLQEMKIFHKTPKFCNFPKQQQGPQTVLKRQTDPEENQAHPQNHKIKQLACSNSEFHHQFMWRKSNYVHKTQGIPEITWDKIFLLNPLHCYGLKSIIFQIHIEEWYLTRCFTTSRGEGFAFLLLFVLLFTCDFFLSVVVCMTMIQSNAWE